MNKWRASKNSEGKIRVGLLPNVDLSSENILWKFLSKVYLKMHEPCAGIDTVCPEKGMFIFVSVKV